MSVFSKMGIFQLPLQQNRTKLNCLTAFYVLTFLDLMNLYIINTAYEPIKMIRVVKNGIRWKNSHELPLRLLWKPSYVTLRNFIIFQHFNIDVNKS